MAGRLILWKNDVQQIKGDAEAEGYKDLLRLDSLSFGAVGYTNTDSDASGTAHQSSMSIEVPFGPWVAELQQRLYHAGGDAGKSLGNVDITEIEQKVDGASVTWKKIREVKLIDAWVESMSHEWEGINAKVSVTIQYSDMTFGVGDKVAHFSRTDAHKK